MKDTSHGIGVLALGMVSNLALKVIAAHISGCLNLSARILLPVGEPLYALDKRRRQYDAGLILSQIEELNFAGVEKVVGVMEADLFVPVFTFVFGEARQGGNAALVSLFRLHEGLIGEDRDSSIVWVRAAKIALHELCHLYNLSHCMDVQCLMHFPGDLEQLDRTPLKFCRYCSACLRDAASR